VFHPRLVLQKRESAFTPFFAPRILDDESVAIVSNDRKSVTTDDLRLVTDAWQFISVRLRGIPTLVNHCRRIDRPHLVDRRIENEIVPLAQKYNIAILPWSPLAMGILAGKYPPGESAPEGSRLAEGRNMMDVRVTQRGREVGAEMVKLAQERGITAAQLALLWCKDQAGITSPIIGPRTMTHLDDALPVLEMSLKDEDRAIFDDLVHPGTAVADFHNSAWWMKARFSDN